jgi:dTDP-4-dehydrorhamnose reductase
MKILLTGKNGQVGFELAKKLSTLGEVIASDREELDLQILMPFDFYRSNKARHHH